VCQASPSCPGLILAACVVLTTAGAFTLLLVMDGDWSSWLPATCLADPYGCFCERDRGTLIRQPSNTFSNLAFTVVGAVVLLECVQQQLKRAASPPLPDAEQPADRLGMAFACSFAISQIVLGAGSAWYHASLTFHGQVREMRGCAVCVTPRWRAGAATTCSPALSLPLLSCH
jgi:hypothetical protein